ncbi:hypothetical protein DE4585_04278 [Mycobacteroides salmoniphilum]|uniref:Uncharacterized protein n=1 Tax=Mycobacteroides salmoniphilum TaxID=404941 RepID=A0A4R8RXW7_9MYCO|nr:hypothetical protein [Mycobacteroides salmoniphilum]TDZ76456.1 hypothetical protein DE4586_04363 [Mycobacteroides salmoniphilum]TDZ78441.1 hypothetical protein DE4585_04278 [Mycobacteroides salmoniphilum]TDZ84974.1 hypothetical protein DE4587_03901 [Mycobacteroides salmoniphilum]
MALVDYRDVFGKIVVGVSVPAILGLGTLMASRWGNAVAYAGGSHHKALLYTCFSIFGVIGGASLIIMFIRVVYVYMAADSGTAAFDPWDLILLVCGLSSLVGGIAYFIDIFTYVPRPPVPPWRFPTPTSPRISPTRIFTPTTTIRWPS